MPRAVDRLARGSAAGAHVDAYQEYSAVVGRLDGGRPLPGPVYEDIRRRAADPSRRLYAYWRNSAGLDCRAVGPQSPCLCGHRYNEHDWGAFETREVRCKMPGCACRCFSYVPVRGSQDLRCSSCKQSYTEHGAGDGGCPRGGGRFRSSWTCSCTLPYDEHHTSFESLAEREAAGRPVDSGWMAEAARQGLPVCHLGGVLGFASLADGVDRAYAGLEDPGGGGAEGSAGAGRLLQRLRDEDAVSTASVVHGRAAGQRALAEVRSRGARQPPPPCPAPGEGGGGGGSGRRPRQPPAAGPAAASATPCPALGEGGGGVSGRRPPAGGPAPASAPAPGPGAARALRDAGAANVGAASAGKLARGRPSSRQAAGRPQAQLPGPAVGGPPPGGAQRGRPQSTPPGASAGCAGRRLGGARARDPEAVRLARLARFEQP